MLLTSEDGLLPGFIEDINFRYLYVRKIYLFTSSEARANHLHYKFIPYLKSDNMTPICISGVSGFGCFVLFCFVLAFSFSLSFT